MSPPTLRPRRIVPQAPFRRYGVAFIGFILAPMFSVSATSPAALDLTYSLNAAMQYNRELIRARELIHQLEGERIHVRSRFLPQVDLTANYAADRSGLDGQTSDNLTSILNFSQRLFEFGPHAVKEVQLRENLRKAVYEYEDSVNKVLARVWEFFHLILLQDRQIATRLESKAGFEDILERERERFKSRLNTEEDVLNAELNVLRQDQRINTLEREQFNSQMELARLISSPIGTELDLSGRLETVEGFALDMEQTVDLALSNSVQLGLVQEQLAEQRRVASEVYWAYSPDIKLDAGVEDGRRRAGVQVGRENNQRAWGVDVSSSLEVNDNQPASEDGDPHWSTRIEARIPILTGGSRIGEERKQAALLRAKEMEVRDLRAEVDLQVRQAYQLMRETLRQKEIQQKTVNIARRRLEINQELKEKGLADDNFFETVRGQFFNELDQLFENQARYIQRQAGLRRLMGHFE